MAWAGLQHVLRTKVSILIFCGKDRFNTPDQLFDCAPASEFHLDNTMPGGHQHHQRQAEEYQKSGDKKCNFRPFISKPANTTSCTANNSGTGSPKSGKSNKRSGGSRAILSPAPWLRKEAYESQKANRQFTHCGCGDHTTYLCTKYCKMNPPDQNSSNNSGYDGKQIKHQ
jgi:hypothetical protein